MKTQKIKLQLRSLDQVLDDFVLAAKRIKSNSKTKVQKGVYVSDLQTARSIFTKRRMQIIKLLKQKPIGSVDELSRALNSKAEYVHKDVAFLSDLGLVELKKRGPKAKGPQPVLLCDKILFEMAA